MKQLRKPIMKIQLNNFGPIQKFDFDLEKDLTIVFGKNNIGKSYAISSIYLILKSFKAEEFSDGSIEMGLFYYRNDNRYIGHGNIRIIEDIIKLENFVTDQIKMHDEIEITNDLKKLFTNIIGGIILNNLEKSFNNSFASLDELRNKLSNKRLFILIQFRSFEFTITVSRGKLIITHFKFYESIVIKKSAKSKKSERLNGKYILYYNNTKKNKSQIIDSLFLEYYMDFKNEITEVLGNIYFLPASRSGLYQALSAFNAVIAELSRSRTFLSNKLELPNISEPVLDYFLSLANVNSKRLSKKFGEIVKIIESKILNGAVSFNEKTKKLVFSPSNIDGELDLAFTSSMISEIAPIVAFLKYVITDYQPRPRYRSMREIEGRKKPSNLIFIEEPEAHLHPEIQVSLMETFCEIIKYDVKIVMTSHSNYMFNKLSNLVLESKIDYKKIGSYLMTMNEIGSNTDSISMAADSDGMADNNFVDVAETLYTERITIYEKLNKDVD